MTIRELNGLRFINQEIKALKEQIEELETEAMRVTPNVVTVKQVRKDGTEEICILPHSGGGGNNDKMPKLVEAIITLQADLEQTKIKRIEEKSKLIRYINNIDDSQLRTIFIYRFIKDFNWVKIAIDLGGGNTDDGIKKKVYRYINNKSCPDCPDCM